VSQLSFFVVKLVCDEPKTTQSFKAVTADAGYESEENYKVLKTRKQVDYIKPQNYEKSKTRNGYMS